MRFKLCKGVGLPCSNMSATQLSQPTHVEAATEALNTSIALASSHSRHSHCATAITFITCPACACTPRCAAGTRRRQKKRQRKLKQPESSSKLSTQSKATYLLLYHYRQCTTPACTPFLTLSVHDTLCDWCRYLQETGKAAPSSAAVTGDVAGSAEEVESPAAELGLTGNNPQVQQTNRILTAGCTKSAVCNCDITQAATAAEHAGGSVIALLVTAAAVAASCSCSRAVE
jgi:hypothetical protein